MSAPVPASVTHARRLAGLILLLTAVGTTAALLVGLVWLSNRPQVVAPLTPVPSAAGGGAAFAPPTAAMPPATSPPQTSAPTPDPVAPSPSGSWVVQLASYDKSGPSSSLAEGLARIRSTVPSAEVIDSDSYASLNPGYWVVVELGPYPSGEHALDFCLAHGLSDRSSCLGRYLSSERSDLHRQCYLEAGTVSPGCREA